MKEVRRERLVRDEDEVIVRVALAVQAAVAGFAARLFADDQEVAGGPNVSAFANGLEFVARAFFLKVLRVRQALEPFKLDVLGRARRHCEDVLGLVQVRIVIVPLAAAAVRAERETLSAWRIDRVQVGDAL